MGVLFFQNGVSMGSDAGWGGWTGSNNYVVRYDFSTGNTGASAVSIALENIWSRQGDGGQYWGFKLSTNPTGYANARAQTPDSNSATLQYASSGYSATLSASGLNLAANTVYYMFVYVVSSGTEYYAERVGSSWQGRWNLTSPRITVTEKPARPGKTTITVSPISPEYGSSVNITVDHYSSAYTYKLYYQKNGQYTLFASGTTSKTVVWNTSVLGSTSTVICNIKCSTYEGATLIDDYVVPITVTFSGVPEVTIQSVTQTSDSSVVNSWQDQGPLYVQGYSKAIVQFYVDWPSGGTYASCYINDGTDNIIAQPVSGLTNVYSATTKAFNTSGARNITATAVDSLGRSGSERQAITVTPYVAPYVVSADAIRYSSSASVQDKSGTNISAKVTASGDWSVNGRNVLVIYARFKQVGEGQSYPYKTTVQQTLVNGGDYVQLNLTQDGGGSVVPVETSRSYTVQFLLCDSLHPQSGVGGLPITVERLVVTSAFVIHSKDGGGGIALGGYNETDEAEIFYPTHLYDHLRVANVTYGEDPPSGPGEEGQVYFKLMHSTGPETGVSTDNYNDLINRPNIDGHLLTTDSTSEDIGLETLENKVTSITSTSTNDEYPSALAVYNAIQNADQAKIHVAKTSDDFDDLVSIVINGNKAVFMYDSINRRVYTLAKFQSSGTNRTLTFALVDGEYIRTLYRSTGDDFWSASSTLIADPTNAKSEVFVVNTPVFTGIQQAYTEGKIILVKYDNNMYQFGWRNVTGTIIEFGFVRIRKDNTIDVITVNNSNNWENYIVDLDDKYELLSNRTIAVTALSTDSQYPTAKAVYDAIRSYSPGGGGGGSEDIFIAIPNNTTYQAVTTALGSGKLVFAVSSGKVYPYVGIYEGNYRFSNFMKTDCHSYTLSSLNEWDTDDWNMGQGGDPSASQIFFATYGTTTYDEIAAAVASGKKLFAYNSSTYDPEIIPSAYKRVQGIKGTGTSGIVIDDIHYDSEMTIETEFFFDETPSASEYITGFVSGSFGIAYHNETGTISYIFANNNNWNDTKTLQLNHLYNVALSKDKFVLDGEEYTEGLDQSFSKQTSKNLRIFCRYSSSTSANSYFTKAYISHIAVKNTVSDEYFDGYSVRRVSDGQLGIYDIITGNFYVYDGEVSGADVDYTNTSMIYGFGGLVDLKYRFYTIGEDRVNYITVGTDNAWGITSKYLVDKTVIAQEFSQSSAYVIGDYVMNNGKLYKCIVAKSASRPWSDTNWQATSIMTEIGNVEAALAALR